jgi:hypothetical protein
VLLLHYRAEIGVARLPKGNRTTIYWRCFIPMESASEAQSPRIVSSAASESSQRSGVWFVFIGVNAILPTQSRRALDGLAGPSV